jgi:hypothetical protein
LEEVKPLSQMNKLLKYSTIAAIGALKIWQTKLKLLKYKYKLKLLKYEYKLKLLKYKYKLKLLKYEYKLKLLKYKYRYNCKLLKYSTAAMYQVEVQLKI